jgi:membrane protease subunit HflK
VDAVKSILSNTSKVMVDLKGGNNLMYLPLDRLLSPDGKAAVTAPLPEPASTRSAPASAGDEATADRSRPVPRAREVR